MLLPLLLWARHFSFLMFFSTLDINPVMQAMLLVWLAIALERLVPISASIDPLTFFRFICERMAQKVLKAHYKDQQAYIAGCLALLVLITPLIIIIYLIREFAGYQWLLDILILWILLQYNDHVKRISRSIQALTENKKQLAKSVLQRSVLRSTDNLSTLGITKSSLESLFLRYNHQYITTLFWFLIAGPIGALAYRFCYESNQIWSPKLPAFAAFGKSSEVATRFFQLIPSVLTSASFMLLTQPRSVVCCFISKQYWTHALLRQRLMLLQSLANALQVNTSGPVIYSADKVRYPRLYPRNKSSIHQQSQSIEPSLGDVKVLISQTNKHLMVSLIIVTWIVFWVSY